MLLAGDGVVSFQLPSPALLLSGDAWGGTGMAWVPRGGPQNTCCLGRNAGGVAWWGGQVWSLQVAGAAGDAAARVPELVNLPPAVGSPHLALRYLL